MAEEPQHWPTERMILEGYAENATQEDLEALDDTVLEGIAEVCQVPTLAPDECIPCLAHAMHLDRMAQRLDSLKPPDSADNGTEEFPETETPKLDALLQEDPPWETVEIHRRPPVEILQLQVEMLRTTLDEIVNGPPIPPKDVSLPELGLLVLAADKWVKITEAQGVELSDPQQAMLDGTKDLVARLRP